MSVWNSAIDGDLPSSSLMNNNNEAARAKYLNFIKTKSRKSEDSIRTKLGLYLGPLPVEKTKEQEEAEKKKQKKQPQQQVGFNFSNIQPKITSSLTTLKGYRIQNLAANNNNNSQQQQSSLRAANLVIDTNTWNKVWESFFNDEASQDAAYDLVRKEGRVQSNRAVLLRLFPSRLLGGVSATMSQTALNSLKKDVETQARSCGPVEFVKIFDDKEILVQFTCESAARVFHGTCVSTPSSSSQSSNNNNNNNMMMAPSPGGFLQRVQNEFGVEDPRPVITNAQRIDLVLALSLPNNNSQQQNNNNSGRKAKGSGVLPALELRVAAEENNNNNSTASGNNTTTASSSSNSTYHQQQSSHNNSNAFSYGIELNESYIKALFNAAGAVETVSVIFDQSASPAASSSSPTTTNSSSPKTATPLPAGHSYRRFYMRFESFLDAQVALHTLQFPLRRIFGLSLNYTADAPAKPEEEEDETSHKKLVPVQGGTSTKFVDEDEE